MPVIENKSENNDLEVMNVSFGSMKDSDKSNGLQEHVHNEEDPVEK